MPHRPSAYIFPILLAMSSAAWVTPAHAQAAQEEFGQNRVQWRRFNWQYLDTTHFRVYFYDKGRKITELAKIMAETELRSIQEEMDAVFPRKINLIVYGSFTDYKQTNIGKDLQLINAAGTLDVVGDRMLIYYNGTLPDLRLQIRKGIARSLMERMLFGENVREIVQNTVLLSLPKWFTDGYVQYVAEGWTPANDNMLKSKLLSGKYKSFDDLVIEDANLAGASFWNYVHLANGKQAVSNLMYLTRGKNGISGAIGVAMRTPYKETLKNWKTFYTQLYQNDNQFQQTPDTLKPMAVQKVKPGTFTRSYAFNPLKNSFSYVRVQNGMNEVVLETADGNKSVIVESPIRSLMEQSDPDYPLMAWSHRGNKLAILFDYKNMMRLKVYNSFKKKVETFYIPYKTYQRITSIQFMENDEELLISAVRNGQSDIFIHNFKRNRFKQLTDDAYDDIQPTRILSSYRKGIAWVSNRPGNDLANPEGMVDYSGGNYNVFFWKDLPNNTKILQCTDIKGNHVQQPIQYGDDRIAYLSDENGVQNRYFINFIRDTANNDSTSVTPATNYSQGIIHQNFLYNRNEVGDVVSTNGKYYFLRTPVDTLNQQPDIGEMHPTSLMKDILKTQDPMQTIAEDKQTEIFKNYFLNDYEEENDTLTARAKEPNPFTAPVSPSDNPFGDNAVSETPGKEAKPKRYDFKFATDFLGVQLDNTLLITRYQPFNYFGGQFQNPTLGGMIRLGITDLFEDYRVSGGFRLPLDFNGSEYYVQVDNFRRRVDWRLLYYRKTEFNYYDLRGQRPPYYSPYAERGRVTTNYVEGMASYPFDVVRSLRLHMGFRSDRLSFSAQNQYSLDIPDDYQNRALVRLEYVQDNTISKAVNLREGTRFKLYGDFHYMLNKPNHSMYNFGFDLRYYKRVYRQITWCSRVSGAHSGGDDKILYYLGGVDNWLNPKFSTATQIDYSQSFAYQATATAMRGYKQNARNGNTYGLINTELRIPVFTTLIKRPLQSAMLRNFQLVPFIDIGAAWYGLLPTDDALSPSYVYQQDQVTVVLNSNTPTVPVGYGLGARTTLLGYYVKVDAGWNIEQKNYKPLWMFSIGYDF